MQSNKFYFIKSTLSIKKSFLKNLISPQILHLHDSILKHGNQDALYLLH